MSPAHKKQVVEAAVKEGVCSGQAGCRILGLSRSGFWYQAGRRSRRQQELVKESMRSPTRTLGTGAAESLPRYIEPGSLWQNGFVESFHGRFRDECLNREQLWTLTEARVVIENYRNRYNPKRPHSRLGYQAQPVTRPVYIHPWLRSGPRSRAFPPLGMDNQRHLYQHRPI